MQNTSRTSYIGVSKLVVFYELLNCQIIGQPKNFEERQLSDIVKPTEFQYTQSLNYEAQLGVEILIEI